MSEYGYSNTKDVLLGKTDKLIKAYNYDRFEHRCCYSVEKTCSTNLLQIR